MSEQEPITPDENGWWRIQFYNGYGCETVARWYFWRPSSTTELPPWSVR